MNSTRVIGECVMNYDPRSMSLDLHPTKVIVTYMPMSPSDAKAHLLKCQEAAPTWTFRLEKVPANKTP